MKAFTDKRRFLWLGGIIVLVLGVLAALMVLPATPAKDPSGPDIRVPKMENVPPEEAPPMKLQ